MTRTLFFILVLLEFQFAFCQQEQWELKKGYFDIENDEVVLNGLVQLKGKYTLNSISISVEIFAETERSFGGIVFGDFDQDNYHKAYLRIHKNGLPDALQYAPVYNGEDTWQLYPQYMQAADWEIDEWNRLNIVIRNGSLSISVNDTSNETLSIPILVEGEAHVGIWSLFDVKFRNFEIRELENETGFEEQAISDSNLPFVPIKNWYLSEITAQPSFDKLDLVQWSRYESNPDGLMPITKWKSKPSKGNFDRNKVEHIWLALDYEVETETNIPFYFDFSDAISIYHNGDLVFQSTNFFRQKSPIYRGDIAPGTHILHMASKKGRNQLRILLSEKANGWGLYGGFNENVKIIEIHD